MKHNFKKKFGQNFISDKNLLTAMVNDAQITKADSVLEIGAGQGSLTEVLDERAGKVISYEIDTELKSTLEGLNLKNTTFIFKDALKEPLPSIEDHFDGKYKIVANLPYYITSPLIFKFLNNSKKVESLTVMVQKEVAKRMGAKQGEDDYGLLSIMIEFYGKAQITRYVDKKMFLPIPKVDSAIVHIELTNKYPNIDGQKFYRFLQACFSMRRKTLQNNLNHAYPMLKDKLLSIFGEDLKKRSEQLSLEEFIKYYKIIEKLI